MTRQYLPAPVRGIAASVLVLCTALAACGGTSASASPSSAQVSAKAATFTAKLAAPIEKTYSSAPNPAVSNCTTPTTGPWSFSYTALATATTPFVTMSVSLAKGAATPAGSPDFRFDLDPGGDSGLPLVFIDQLGQKSGAQGSTGKATVSTDAAGAHVHVEGTARAKGAPGYDLNDLTFDLTCPSS